MSSQYGVTLIVLTVLKGVILVQIFFGNIILIIVGFPGRTQGGGGASFTAIEDFGQSRIYTTSGLGGQVTVYGKGTPGEIRIDR